MGGSWERVQDVFPLFAGTTYAAGSTGGEANVTLKEEQGPPHNHGQAIRVYNDSFSESAIMPNRSVYWDSSSQCYVVFNQTVMKHVASFNGAKTADAGSGQPHNNMPPYRTFYCWERVA